MFFTHKCELMEPPNEDIKIKIFHNRKEVETTSELKSELEEIYKRKLKEQKFQKQNNIFKAEILCYKIRRILPDNPFIPQTILRLIKNNDVFNQFTIFLDTCFRIKRLATEWKVKEIDFNHDLYKQLSLVHKELSETIHQYVKGGCSKTDTLIKKVMEQAYLPAHITLMIDEAKKIIRKSSFKFSEELENELSEGLKNLERYHHFKVYIEHCKKALDLKSQEKEIYQNLLKKIKLDLFPLFFVYFRSYKNTLCFSQSLLKIVETPQTQSFLYYFWKS